MIAHLILLGIIEGAGSSGPGPTVAESIYPIVLRRRRRR